MYISVRRYAIDAGSIDGLAHMLEDELAPAISQEPGFLGYLAIDSGDATVETVSVFTDAASGRRSDDLAGEYLAEFEVTRTGVSGGDVLAGRMAPAILDAVHRSRAHRVRGRQAGPRTTVLVVGATGRTGRQIVERLLARNVPVRALVRDAARGREILPAGASRFVGDVRRPETLAQAIEGVGAMIVATAGGAAPDNSPIMVEYFGTQHLMREAAAQGVGLVIFVSSIYASRPDHYQDVEPTSLGWKARAEEVVRASGVPYCIVRAGWLTDGPGGEALALSQGDTGEGHISRTDLADISVRLLELADGHGKTFEVTAPPGCERRPLEDVIAELRPDGPIGAGNRAAA